MPIPDTALRRTIYLNPTFKKVGTVVETGYNETTLPKLRIKNELPGANIIIENGCVLTIRQAEVLGRPKGDFLEVLAARLANARLISLTTEEFYPELETFKALAKQAVTIDRTKSTRCFWNVDWEFEAPEGEPLNEELINRRVDAKIEAARTPSEVFDALPVSPAEDCSPYLLRSF